MRHNILLSLLTALLGVTLTAGAQIKTDSLDKLVPKAKEVTDINLDSSTLQLAGGMLGSQGSLSGVRALQVKTFEFAQEGQYQMSDLDPIRAQLQTPEWKRIVSTQEKREITEIYSRTEGGHTTGFALLTAEPK